jgi:hypothetical protein
LNSLNLRIICTKFDWTWPAGSGEENTKKKSVYFYSCYYLPLEKGVPLHLNKLKAPPHKDDLRQVWSNWLSGSGEEVENVKVYKQTDDQKSSLELSAQVS